MSEYTMMVAGYSHYQPALKSLLEKNYLYSCSKSELINEIDIDEKVYEYEQTECSLAIIHEPNNQFDPAALMVYADGKHIGYVPRGRLSDLGKLSRAPGLKMSVRIYGGPYKYLEYDEDEDYFGTMESKYFKVCKETDQVRAIMIFRW